MLTIAVLHLLDTSRTGRAWRAVREDPLAAGMMTIPVNRVKLMAFSFGAVVAALAGTIFAAQQISVFPTDFETPFLILIYAGLILGGAGSIAGAVLGGLVLSITLDGFLRSPTQAGYMFYGVILLTLIVKLRPWTKLVADRSPRPSRSGSPCTGSSRRSRDCGRGRPGVAGWIADLVRGLGDRAEQQCPRCGNIGFVVLLCLLIALVQVRGRWRTFLIPPTLCSPPAYGRRGSSPCRRSPASC